MKRFKVTVSSANREADRVDRPHGDEIPESAPLGDLQGEALTCQTDTLTCQVDGETYRRDVRGDRQSDQQAALSPLTDR